MRIVSVASRRLQWPLASQGAARGRTERAALVIEVRTDGGAIGLGEAAPLPGMSRDTLDDAVQATATFAARAPFEVDDRATAYWIAAAVTDAPAARFAIETALLDALARERRISLAALLRASANDIPAAQPAAHVDTRPSVLPGGPAIEPSTLPLAAVVDDPDAARRALAAGIRCLKIKVGPDDDLARVVAIARAAPGTRLRIDANRAWPRAEVAARLAALAPLPIDYVEEPCRDAHRLLSAPLPYRLALDESLASLTPGELEAALASPALAAVVLKPTLLGGLTAAWELAERARRARVAAIASHGLEGPIGTAACAELALALGGPHAAGLAAHPALDGWRVAVAQLAPDHVRPVATPGLGFGELDLAGVVAACPGSADGGPIEGGDR